MYPTRPGRLHLTVAAGVLIVLLIVQQRLVQIPGSGRVAAAVPDALHGSWFACVTWAMLILVGRWTRRGTTLAATALLGFGLAAGSEFLQKFTGGDAEVNDVFFDMLGMSVTLCIWSAREKLIAPRFGVAMATVLMLATLWPIVPPLLIDRYRDSIAPELVRFDSAYAWDLIRSSSVTDIVPAPNGWSIAGPVLKIALAVETWPGVHLNDPIAQWQRYSELDVDVFVEGETPIPITISVRLDNAPVDHVSRAFDCLPGPCRLAVPLADLFDRDVARVNAVVIHSRRAYAGRVLYLGRVTLRKQAGQIDSAR